MQSGGFGENCLSVNKFKVVLLLFLLAWFITVFSHIISLFLMFSWFFFQSLPSRLLAHVWCLSFLSLVSVVAVSNYNTITVGLQGLVAIMVLCISSTCLMTRSLFRWDFMNLNMTIIIDINIGQDLE